MFAPSREELVAQIEAAIESGDLAAAHRLLAETEAGPGRDPMLDELRQRLEEVESISSSGGVESAMRLAQEEIGRANYPRALELLQGAIRQEPGHVALREMLVQTTQAAMRHDSAVERNREVTRTAEHIEGLLARGELDTAAGELQQAGIHFGRHNTLTALQERLAEARRESGLEKTVAYADQGRAFLDGKNWRGALREAERILRLDPKNSDALQLRQTARAEIERETAAQAHMSDIRKAAHDTERLIAADELERATRALEEAVERLGRDRLFEDLAQRLDQAKVNLQSRKRLEWTQRRLNEAESLVREAGRLSLQGKYEQAIERLLAARELHPEHAEIPGMVQAAESALERGAADRHRAEELLSAKSEIRSLLDGLLLDEAEARLQTTVTRFGEDPQLAALRTRLARLREAEHAADSLPGATAELDPETETQALAYQKALAAAYSWKQTLLYPLRGGAATLCGGLLLLALALEILDGIPGVGVFFAILRFLLPFLALGFVLPILRETFAGHNVLPPPAGLIASAATFTRDLALVAGTAFVATLPLAFFVVTRGGHALLGGESGAAGWLLSAVLGWLAVFLALPACASAVFGTHQVPRLPRHLRSLSQTGGDTLAAVDVAFAVAVAAVVLRASLARLVPWLGVPLAAAAEVWLLVGLPHLVGVVLRRHRVELGKVYG